MRWLDEEYVVSRRAIIGGIVAGLLINFAVGVYRGYEKARDEVCVLVRHSGMAEDYRVCGERTPVKREYQ